MVSDEYPFIENSYGHHGPVLSVFASDLRQLEPVCYDILHWVGRKRHVSGQSSHCRRRGTSRWGTFSSKTSRPTLLHLVLLYLIYHTKGPYILGNQSKWLCLKMGDLKIHPLSMVYQSFPRCRSGHFKVTPNLPLEVSRLHLRRCLAASGLKHTAAVT